MTQALLEGHDLDVYRGERLVLSKISLNFNKGEKVAVIGRNGAGKTTLLMALAGITKYEGNLFYQSKPCHHGEHRQ
ncbi:MAG: ATP-binding cassette domain-containing protein, partial [Actinobacteria bacterium]|nr:ATP-binding cassette domain-containing protein [Actinomycetota bacterium]